MSWRIAIRHNSRYDYDSPVSASYNEARMTPMTTDRQLTHDGRVDVDPHTRPLRYVDYWGTVVDAFDLHTPHRTLTVTGSSLVETSPPLSGAGDASWADLADEDLREELAQFLDRTPFTVPDDRVSRAAEELRGRATPGEAAIEAGAWVRDRLVYEPGRTHVSTSAAEALEAGAGVCQDFAHVALALLRTMGIPARYVSGYLHPSPDAGLGQAVQGQSHAWVEVWNGGWRGDDVTNGIPAGERHVIVARARDYADVTPLKGIIQGGTGGRVLVDVALTRVG